MYYVYAYIDPRTDKPFYIGKGSGNRYLHHLNETKDNTENKKKYAHIKGLQNKGLDPKIIKLQENLIETEAYDLETKLIKKYGRKGIDKNGILTNICIDNRPPKKLWTNKERALVSKRMIGNTYGKGLLSPFKGKKRPELQGINNGFYGEKHDAKTKYKMHQSRIKFYKSGGVGPMTGKHHTEETKRKVQLNNPNRKIFIHQMEHF